MNKDIILIFGGDGKIAQAIVRKYLDLNCLVIAVDKKEKNDNTEFNKNENYHYFSTDITSVDKLTDLYNKLSLQVFFSEISYHFITCQSAKY